MSAIERFLRDLESEKVAVVVGTGAAQKAYQVPKDHLCSNSKWFEAALKDDRFKEGVQRTIELPEDSPQSFEAFLFFTHRLHLVYDLPETQEGQDEIILQCVQSCAFADKYLMAPLHNASLHMICTMLSRTDASSCILSAETISSCLDASATTPRVRVLLADHLVWQMEQQDARTHEQDPVNIFGAEQASALGKVGDLSFMLTVHASEQALRELPKGDFPRYEKPTKYKALLHVNMHTSDDDQMHTVAYWHEPAIRCGDCGFGTSNQLDVYCRDCKSLRNCVCEGDSDFIQLCDDCVDRQVYE